MGRGFCVLHLVMKRGDHEGADLALKKKELLDGICSLSIWLSGFVPHRIVNIHV